MVGAVLMGALAGLQAVAQSYSLDWWRLSGGAGTSTGGLYSVSGTAGQPEVGAPMSGGNYSLVGGFWSLVAAVQTPGAPRLTITRMGGGFRISWPSSATAFSLQQNTTIADPSGWLVFRGPVADDGTTRSVNIAVPGGNLFFRLAK
jgi:hypothetical protein